MAKVVQLKLQYRLLWPFSSNR